MCQRKTVKLSTQLFTCFKVVRQGFETGHSQTESKTEINAFVWSEHYRRCTDAQYSFFFFFFLQQIITISLLFYQV